MKTIDFYAYESNKVRIYWKNIIQPVGVFKSARSANTFINDNLILSPSELSDYKISTPDGNITPEYDPKPLTHNYR